MKTFTDPGLDEDSPIVKLLVKEFKNFCANSVLVPLHAVLSYKERLYKERLVEHENHKERTLVKLGRVKEHPQLGKYAI